MYKVIAVYFLSTCWSYLGKDLWNQCHWT